MSILDFFEDMRRANADWYTANPLEQLDEEDLARLAAEAGMTIEELRQHISTPHVEMTCPLCGRPSTHLVNCKGCGGDAWGGEFVFAYGEDVHDRLQAQYEAALTHEEHIAEIQAQMGDELPLITLEQVEYATKNAYAWGGCMVCQNCWHNTLPVDAFRTCPIKLLADHTLNEAPTGALVEVMLSFPAEDKAAHQQRVLEWVQAAWRRWTEVWNTVADEEARKAVALWRHLLLKAALR